MTTALRVQKRYTDFEDPRLHADGWDPPPDEVFAEFCRAFADAVDDLSPGSIGRVCRTMGSPIGFTIEHDDTTIAISTAYLGHRKIGWTPMAEICETAAELATTTINEDETCDHDELVAANKEASYTAAITMQLISIAEEAEYRAWSAVEAIYPEVELQLRQLADGDGTLSQMPKSISSSAQPGITQESQS